MNAGDAVLLERWRTRRDAQAFAELAGRYAGLVYSACRRVLGNDIEAEDVAQECFLSLAQKAPRERQSLGPWLYVVATNRALNRRKSRVRRADRERRYAEAAASRVEPDWDDVQQYVDEVIAALPEKLRRPIVLHFLEGHSQGAVAELLGLPRTTVNARITRGIDETRAQLKRRGIGVGAAALGTMLAGRSSMAAPAALTAALGRLALAGTHGGTGGAAVLAAGGGALKLLVAGAVFVVAVATVYVIGFNRGAAPATGGGATAAAADAPRTVEAMPAPLPRHEADALPAAASTGVLKGRVVDQNGDPVADADVVVGVADKATARVKTDASGDFGFQALSGGPFMLHAFKSGVGLASRAAVPAQGDAGELALAPMASISGRVYDRATGGAIPGFEISLDNLANPEVSVQAIHEESARDMLDLWHGHPIARTDAEGRYQFPDLFPAKHFFACVQNTTDYVFPGFQDPIKEVTLERGQAMTGVDLGLVSGASLSGTVYGEQNAPLVKARVKLMPIANSQIEYDELKTQEDGRYRFRGLPLGVKYTVLVSHEDFASQISEPVLVAGKAGVDGVDFHMAAGYALAGFLRFDSGAPIAGAELCFYRGRGNRCESDANGRFSFAHVMPGEYTFWIYKEHLKCERPEFKFTMPARNMTDLVVTLNGNAPGEISGLVVDSSGSPVANVNVRASNHFVDRPVDEQTDTGPDGRFKFQALGDTAECSVEAYCEGYRWAREDKVPVGTTDLELVMYRMGTVSGKVLDEATGDPVREYQIRQVWLLAEDGQTIGNKTRWEQFNSDDGSFLLDDASPPALRLEVMAKGYAPAKTGRVEMPEGGHVEDVVVKLGRGTKLTGRIVDARTGAGIAGAKACAYGRENGHVYFNGNLLDDTSRSMLGYTTCVAATTDSEGAFTLDPLTPGETVGMAAWGEGYATQVFPAFEVGGTGPLTIRLEPEGRLEIQLQNKEAVGERVIVSCRQTGVPEAQAISMADGTGLPAGQYEIVLDTLHSRRLLGIVTATVRAGETTQVPIDLAVLGNMFGAIYGIIEMEGVWVNVSPADSGRLNYASTGCDETGMWRMGGLPPGEYEIKGYRFGEDVNQYYEGTARVMVEAGQEQEVRIDMAPAVHPALR